MPKQENINELWDNNPIDVLIELQKIKDPNCKIRDRDELQEKLKNPIQNCNFQSLYYKFRCLAYNKNFVTEIEKIKVFFTEQAEEQYQRVAIAMEVLLEDIKKISPGLLHGVEIEQFRQKKMLLSLLGVFAFLKLEKDNAINLQAGEDDRKDRNDFINQYFNLFKNLSHKKSISGRIDNTVDVNEYKLVLALLPIILGFDESLAKELIKQSYEIFKGASNLPDPPVINFVEENALLDLQNIVTVPNDGDFDSLYDYTKILQSKNIRDVLKKAYIESWRKNKFSFHFYHESPNPQSLQNCLHESKNRFFVYPHGDDYEFKVSSDQIYTGSLNLDDCKDRSQLLHSVVEKENIFILLHFISIFNEIKEDFYFSIHEIRKRIYDNFEIASYRAPQTYYDKENVEAVQNQINMNFHKKNDQGKYIYQLDTEEKKQESNRMIEKAEKILIQHLLKNKIHSLVESGMGSIKVVLIEREKIKLKNELNDLLEKFLLRDDIIGIAQRNLSQDKPMSFKGIDLNELNKQAKELLFSVRMSEHIPENNFNRIISTAGEKAFQVFYQDLQKQQQNVFAEYVKNHLDKTNWYNALQYLQNLTTRDNDEQRKHAIETIVKDTKKIIFDENRSKESRQLAGEVVLRCIQNVLVPSDNKNNERLKEIAKDKDCRMSLGDKVARAILALVLLVITVSTLGAATPLMLLFKDKYQRRRSMHHIARDVERFTPPLPRSR